jgi:hypothetical protein
MAEATTLEPRDLHNPLNKTEIPVNILEFPLYSRTMDNLTTTLLGLWRWPPVMVGWTR